MYRDAADFCGGPQDLEAKILKREDIIDQLRAEITSYMVDLSRQELTLDESALIPSLIHAVNDPERIGDRSENLIELTQLRRQGTHPITDFAEKDLRELQGLLNKQFHAIYRTLENEDSTHLIVLKNRAKEIVALNAKVAERRVEGLKSGQCEVQAGVIFLDLMSNLSRIGEHLVNIEERAAEILDVTHQ